MRRMTVRVIFGLVAKGSGFCDDIHRSTPGPWPSPSVRTRPCSTPRVLTGNVRHTWAAPGSRGDEIAGFARQSRLFLPTLQDHAHAACWRGVRVSRDVVLALPRSA